MTKTPRYTASIEGQTFTRNSERTYSHVVVARYTRTWDTTTRSYVEAPADAPYRVLGFCGRADLAQQVAHESRELRADGAPVLNDVTILPLTDTRA